MQDETNVALFDTFLPKPNILAQQIPINGVPIWVKPISFSKEVADTTNTSGGYYDLVSDEQWNIPSKEAFHHFAQKILTEKGLENSSAISQSYDPTCETLTFHSIIIHRDGQTIDKLKNGKFEVLRREENMERLIYNGDLTAVFNLHDLRIGDVLEYSYTVKGWNPAFGNKFSSSIYLNYGVPVGLVYVRLITDEKNPLNISYVNQVPAPEISVAKGKKYYEWRVENVPALTYEDGTPNWYEPYDRIDVSDFKTWEEISSWSYNLFSSAFVTNKALDAKIEEFKSEPNKDEAINHCIRFVQDEIRYLSFSDGIHGYKPHSAYKIFDQRYGDCKDKSVLLSYMLTQLGVDSHPALVHSTKGEALSKLPASPIRFNHCIVTFGYRDSTYWVDPTMSLQRGELKHRYLPNYAYGLIIEKKGNGLSQIPGYSGESKITLEEIFDVASVGTSAILKVITTYRGDEANTMRDQFRESNLSNVTKNYLNFYASDYPEIKSTKQITTKDDEKENVFITEEEYSIDPFWKYDTAQHKYTVQIYPRSLTSYLKKPDTKIRSMPYSLTFPQNVSHQIN